LHADDEEETMNKGRMASSAAQDSREGPMTPEATATHSILVGYVLWIFGFTGSHRFYYGKPITGTIWFFTLGLLGIGWLVDLLLIPGMARRASFRYQPGHLDYTVAWVLLTFLGIFGIHRLYLGKWITGIVYLLTCGLLGLGLLYDLWTLNGQVSEMNRRAVLEA
jgi:TM2 domain-containing membrane protein YozV